MRLRDLLDSRRDIQRERLIGKEIELMDQEALILGIQEVETVIDGELEVAARLLLLCEDENLLEEEERERRWAEDDDWEDEEQEKTNRQQLIEDMDDSGELDIADIETFIIGGRRYETLGAMETCLEEGPYEEILMLKRFAEAEAIPEDWLERDTESLVLIEYDVEPEMFDVDWDVDILPMEVEISEPAEEVLVGKVLECSLGHYDLPKTFSLRGRGGEEIHVDIHGVYPHDIWTDAACLNEDFSELEELCGRDQRLLLVEYGTDPDVQLNFYTKDFLDSPAYEDSEVPGLLLFPADEDADRRLCVVDVVPEGFDEPVELELLSYLI